MVWTEGQQSQKPGPFDCRGETPLMLGADSSFASGLHLVPVRHVPSQFIDLFVVDKFYVLYAKRTQFSPGVIPGPATRPSTCWWPSACCRHVLHLLIRVYGFMITTRTLRLSFTMSRMRWMSLYAEDIIFHKGMYYTQTLFKPTL